MRYAAALISALILLAPAAHCQNSLVPVNLVQTDQPSIADRLREQLANVVRVNGNDGSWGSGTYLGNGYVLTAAHVLRGGRSWTVYFRDGHTSPAKAIAIDSTFDQALLQTQRVHPRALGVQLADNNPAVGDNIVVGGFDHASPVLLLRPGRLTMFMRPSSSHPADWFEVNNRVEGGASGGPAFNETGKLIGNLWGSGRDGTVSVTTGRTRKFLQPFNGRLIEWWRKVHAGKRPLQIFPGGLCYGGNKRAAPDAQPTIPVVPTDPPTKMILEIGVVQTLPPGSSATVSLRKEGDRTLLDFGIPCGPAGPPGEPKGVNVEALAKAILATLEPITVNSVNSKGEILDTVTVPLGGTLNINHKPLTKK